MFDVETIIRVGGVLGIAAIVFVESGLFFGFFLPGDSLLFGAGFLASQGVIPITPLVLLSIIAAIAGDSVGYWFGRKVGPMIFVRKDSFFFSQKRVEDTRLFFEKYGAKSVLLARFVPAVRTFTPILAGVGGMRYRTFLTYNIVGALLWAGALPLSAYFLGSKIPGMERYISFIIVAIIGISVLPIAIPLAKHYLFRSGKPPSGA